MFYSTLFQTSLLSIWCIHLRLILMIQSILQKYYNKTSVGEIRDLIKDTDFGRSSFEIETLTYLIYSLIWQYERNPNAFSLGHYVCGVNVWDP
ncbi:uncharacterized protein OCT59_008453 [Rhizophagus irregularis]|uniref:uncharacterized protein n=1 Tax=Rhizophagus irregularis TaxID=588596 RepID=UPI0033294119|nr:hypothetical protein OCT59_008453 [Rhizophagus irregularis]